MSVAVTRSISASSSCSRRTLLTADILADEMLAGDRVVRRYETSFVKKRRKLSLALPLRARAP